MPVKAKKLTRFAAIKNFSNVLEFPEEMAGKWTEVCGNENPLVLELACGKGEYTVNMAKAFPRKKFHRRGYQGKQDVCWCTKSIEGKHSQCAFPQDPHRKYHTIFYAAGYQ